MGCPTGSTGGGRAAGPLLPPGNGCSYLHPYSVGRTPLAPRTCGLRAPAWVALFGLPRRQPGGGVGRSFQMLSRITLGKETGDGAGRAVAQTPAKCWARAWKSAVLETHGVSRSLAVAKPLPHVC